MERKVLVKASEEERTWHFLAMVREEKEPPEPWTVSFVWKTKDLKGSATLFVSDNPDWKGVELEF